MRMRVCAQNIYNSNKGKKNHYEKQIFFMVFCMGMLRERDTEKESADTERLELMRSLRDEGKSYREIAEIMDISKSSVHRILSY